MFAMLRGMQCARPYLATAYTRGYQALFATTGGSGEKIRLFRPFRCSSGNIENQGESWFGDVSTVGALPTITVNDKKFGPLIERYESLCVAYLPSEQLVNATKREAKVWTEI
jgi:hypothetical protein